MKKWDSLNLIFKTKRKHVDENILKFSQESLKMILSMNALNLTENELTVTSVG